MSAIEDQNELHMHDWYAVLHCSYSATKEEIEKSARKMFLKYHPDKTADPEAPAKFLLVQKAKEILLDSTKRSIIDKLREKTIKRKLYDDKRNDTMDRERKRMKEELSRKMNEAAMKPSTLSEEEKKKADENFRKKKIIELREKNSARVDKSSEEANIKLQQREQELKDIRKQALNLDNSTLSQIKVKWKRDAFYSVEDLQEIFSRFGTIEAIELSQSKGSSAIIIYSTSQGAILAVEAYLISQEFRVSQLNSGSSVFHQYSSGVIPAKTAGVGIGAESGAEGPPAAAPTEPEIAAMPKASAETLLSKEADVLRKMMEMKGKKKAPIPVST